MHLAILALASKAQLVFAAPLACLGLLAYRDIQAPSVPPACWDQLALVAILVLVVPVRLVRLALPVLEASKELMELLAAWVPLVLVQLASEAKLVLASKAPLA